MKSKDKSICIIEAIDNRDILFMALSNMEIIYRGKNYTVINNAVSITDPEATIYQQIITAFKKNYTYLQIIEKGSNNMINESKHKSDIVSQVKEQKSKKELLTIKEAAAYVGLNYSAFVQRHKNGVGPKDVIKGKKRFYKRESLDKYLENKNR